MDVKQAARTFRFTKWDEVSPETREFLRANVHAVANELPKTIGETLYEVLELSVPANYEGKVEIDPNESMREKVRFKHPLNF